MTPRRLLLAVLGVGGVAVLAACGSERAASSGTVGGPAPWSPPPVIASEAYAQTAGPRSQATKLEALRQAVERLRAESGSSGWQVRQDDVTGDAAELFG